jgi:hypothetical protein
VTQHQGCPEYIAIPGRGVMGGHEQTFLLILIIKIFYLSKIVHNGNLSCQLIMFVMMQEMVISWVVVVMKVGNC